jgi:hypothetical protein
MEQNSKDTNLFRKLLAQSNMNFDYEVNNIQYHENKNRDGNENENPELYFMDKAISMESKNYSKIYTLHFKS